MTLKDLRSGEAKQKINKKAVTEIIMKGNQVLHGEWEYYRGMNYPGWSPLLYCRKVAMSYWCASTLLMSKYVDLSIYTFQFLLSWLHFNVSPIHDSYRWLDIAIILAFSGHWQLLKTLSIIIFRHFELPHDHFVRSLSLMSCTQSLAVPVAIPFFVVVVTFMLTHSEGCFENVNAGKERRTNMRETRSRELCQIFW